eukprot:CAMPEP_0176175306 /NCGR_PEP_ID=MMETSP0120_2-20121206/89809_1 /TAXON_ID=160619 /ORGANISM="Kryptoperidinium foliaceum, Strain CCMP 1326" /LENGTH=136 /DNA_ID=CAMNT_0017513351 /DNA_START=187 /DNA_END=597 /DNA_ORIENTATION=+
MGLRLVFGSAVMMLVILSFLIFNLYLENSGTFLVQHLSVESLQLKKNFVSTTTRDEKISVDKPSATLPRNMSLNDIPISMMQQLKQKSSVDYFACCGLGHRMSKMVDAHYIATFGDFAMQRRKSFIRSLDHNPWKN